MMEDSCFRKEAGMKKIMWILIFASFVSTLVLPLAFADDSRMCGCEMCRCDMMGMQEKMWSKMELDDMFLKKAHFILANADEIGLNDEQAQKVEALKLSVKKSLIKHDADIELLALDIKEELGKEEINTATVNSLIDKKYGVKAQKAKDIVGAYADIKKSLTKEQQQKLKDMWLSSMTGRAKCMMMEKGDKQEKAY
jgi:hypothetical protein